MIGVAGFIWQIKNMRGVNARGRRRRVEQAIAGTRRTDRSKLSRHERRLYDQAQKLLKQGKILPAAQILEQIGLPRDAITALESAGLIHDAAKILMRMQRHNRAGVVYARHGMWDHAAKCFKMANMPLEVAKCYREAGDFAQALEFFEKAGRHEDAAACCIQLNDLQRAGRSLIAAGQTEKAMNIYAKFVDEQYNPATLEFAPEELSLLVTMLSNGHGLETRIPEILATRNRLISPIFAVARSGNIRAAANLLNRAGPDIGPAIIAEINYQDGTAEGVAQTFLAANAPEYAGMVYERMGSFEAAGDAFESANEFERAAYCFERANKDKKARAAKERAKHEPRKQNFIASPFALNNLLQTSTDKSFGGSAGESTVIIDTSGDIPSTTPITDDTSGPPEPAHAPAVVPAPPASPPRPVMAKKPIVAALSAQPGDFRLAVDDSPAKVATTPIIASNEIPNRAEEFRAVFDRSSFLHDLDQDQKGKLWEIGQTVTYDREETILTYNDEPTGIYIILAGAVRCFKQQGNKETYLDEMGETESFGELWLLAEHPSAVKFVANAQTSVHIIERGPFNALLDKDGAVARKLYKRFTHRLLRRLLKPAIPQSNQKAS